MLGRRGLLAMTGALGVGLVTSGRRARADGLGDVTRPVPDPPGWLSPAVRGGHRQEAPLPDRPPGVPYRPGEVIWSIPTSRKIVVLTFDDGPDRVHDLALGEILRVRGYEGKATFFCIGRNVASFPGVTQELFDRGYTIGNHTMSHAHYDAASEAAEIGPCQDVIHGVTGEYPWAFRAAGGTKSPAIDQACAAHGLVYIWTDGDENDWMSPRLSPGELNARFAHYLHPGYISLRHSGGSHDNTVAAMHSMLDIIESNGYEVTSLYDALSMRDDGVHSARPGEGGRATPESANADGIVIDITADRARGPR